MSPLNPTLDPTPTQAGLDESASVARGLIDTALGKVTPLQREQFWNAIGLYYSTRRHPGADETAPKSGDTPA